jgi:hypothetical protein
MSASARYQPSLAGAYENSEAMTGADRLVLTLTVLGMIASAVMVTIVVRAVQDAGEVGEADIYKPAVFYIVHAIQLTLLLAAGVAALLNTDFREIERGFLPRLALFFGAALLMTARGYTASDLLSTRLADSTGPVPCFMSVLIFVGARRKYWGLLDKIFAGQAIYFSAISVFGLARMRMFTRDAGLSNLATGLNALYFPAAWIALRDYPRDSNMRRFRFLPMALFTFFSLFTQTRLNIVMVFCLLGVYAYIQYRRRMPQAGLWLITGGLAVWLTLFVATFLRDTSGFRTLESVADAFSSRINEDTRSSQLIRFAENVKPEELLLGRGSLATWDWGKTVNYKGGTDVGYLTLLLYGGLPLFLTYVAVHLKPCFTALAANPSQLQLAAAGVLLLWTIRMFSSSYMGLTLDYYPILLCVGACISREPFPVWRGEPARA